MTDRREFLKKMAIGGTAALAAPSIITSCTAEKEAEAYETTEGGLIVPKDNRYIPGRDIARHTSSELGRKRVGP